MKNHIGKKIISVILACLLISLTATPLSLAAVDSTQKYSLILQNADSTSHGSVSVEAGKSFTLELTLTRTDVSPDGIQQILTLQDEIQYSSEYLRLDNVEILAHDFFADYRDMSNGIDKKIQIQLLSKNDGAQFIPHEYDAVQPVALITFTALKDGETKIQQVNQKVIKDGYNVYESIVNDVDVKVGAAVPTQYKITVTNPANGVITTTPAGKAAAGGRVDLSVTLSNGYSLSLWVVTDADNQSVNVASSGIAQNGAFFIMPNSDVTVTAALSAPLPPVDPPGPQNPGGGTIGGGETPPPLITIDDSEVPLDAPDKARFDDVQKTHWAYPHIEYLAELGFVTGKTANLFYPADTITRGEFVTILARMSGENLPRFNGQFLDVDATAYYAKSVAWAVATGVTQGTSATTFSPNDKIERQQIAAMIARYAAYKGFGFGIANEAEAFTDSAKIAAYAAAAVTAMQKANIINGYTDGSFKPVGYATRAEAAKMLALVHSAMFPNLLGQLSA